MPLVLAKDRGGYVGQSGLATYFWKMLARVVFDAWCLCKALLQQYLAWANNAEGAVGNNLFQEGARC